MKILIIEDEPDLAHDIAEYLNGQSYQCEFAKTFDSAIEKINLYDYDCILLDLTLPGGSGIDILKHLKNTNKQEGVIILSAKNSIEDKVLGLQIGADDYLSKPFNHSELAARIYSLMRRKQFDSSNIIEFEELKINLLSKTVHVRGIHISLTKKEYDLLIYFIGNKNKVVSKNALAEHLSGDIAEMFNNHDFIYAHIKNLKRKLKEGGCKNYLKSIYGSGYRWDTINND